MSHTSTLTKLAVAAGIGFGFRAIVRRSRYLDLRGRTIVVTGGSRGLGLAIAREAVARGAKVALCARDESELLAAREDLIRRGARDVLAVQCDVTIPAQVNGFVQGVLDHFGSIDVLVNNAGVITVAPIDSMTFEDFEREMQTHFSAPLYTMLAILPSMRLRRRGRIVNITSIGGKVPVPHLVPYCASKFALVGLSESMRAELARDKVFVTTVVPGLMRTGSARNINVKGQTQKEYAWFVTGDVTPGISTEPRRVASRILDAASFGQAELVVPMIYRAAIAVHGLAPGLSTELAGIVNRLLPDPGGIGTRRAKGYQSDSRLVPQLVRQRNAQAAQMHNEVRQTFARSPPL